MTGFSRIYGLKAPGPSCVDCTFAQARIPESLTIQILNLVTITKSFTAAQHVLYISPASMEQSETVTVPRRQLASERRLPLRQRPSELPYSVPPKP